MRGKTQVGTNESKDRNANGRVDPFHMPTELADGLEAESLPRGVMKPRLAPAEIRLPAKAAGSTTQTTMSSGTGKSLRPRWILRAPGCECREA